MGAIPILDHEPICQALFALLASGAPFLTTGRRVIDWRKVEEQPALFLRQTGEIYPARAAYGLPDKVTLKYECWLYTKTILDDADGPGAALGQLIYAVRQALAPDFSGTLTLGGLVQHCWIEGDLDFDNGDLDTQAKAIIPIHILTLG